MTSLLSILWALAYPSVEQVLACQFLSHPESAAIIARHSMRFSGSAVSLHGLNREVSGYRRSQSLYAAFGYLTGDNKSTVAVRDPASRFIGAVESLVGATPPQFWIDAVEAAARPYTRFPLNRKVKLRDLGRNVFCLNNAPLASKNAGAVYLLLDKDLDISALLKDVQARNDNSQSMNLFAAAGERGTVLLAAHTDAGYSYPVYCYSNTTNKALSWKCEVWASYRETSTGQNSHFVSLAIARDQLVVYGSDGLSVYVEAFDLRTGMPLLRFSSCLWMKRL